jgi:hypothetical protein
MGASIAFVRQHPFRWKLKNTNLEMLWKDCFRERERALLMSNMKGRRIQLRINKPSMLGGKELINFKRLRHKRKKVH